jgi:hypothetical protein
MHLEALTGSSASDLDPVVGSEFHKATEFLDKLRIKISGFCTTGTYSAITTE